LVAVVLLATSAGGSGGGYTVRAIFDDAANAIAGEDVKIDNVKVGTIGSVVATPQGRAAVTLEIENPGFQDFRTDATCTIRPQALIGEKFVDCLPTQVRPAGTPLPPPLPTIPAGREGEGDRLLPVANTSSPVDPDLLQAITRLPERQRLTILLNELGTGLAGRGSDLHEVIRRADPTLRELDKVLAILAGENHTLVTLAENGDKALAPLTADREQFADFFVQANTVARATALHRGALARNLALFPVFLRELGPALARLGQFAEQTTPVFADLGIAAPGINQAFTHLAPFADSSTAFFQTFGRTAQAGGPALTASQPLFNHVQALGTAIKPLATNLSGLLSSVRDTGGLERILDTIFLGAGSTNGYNALGHFLRAQAVVTPCVTYVTVATSGCNAKFQPSGATAAAASSASTQSLDANGLVMARTLAVLKGATAAQAIAEYPGSVPSGSSLPGGFASPGAATPTAQPVGGASAGTTYYSPAGEGSSPGGLLLNYLLGN